MFGFFNIHKPPGPTSHDVVFQLRRRLGQTIRIGHAGTLDPFAEGVLVVCVGAATRLAEYVQRQNKTYRAGVVLGTVSTTDDAEGELREICPAAPSAASLAPEALQTILQRFVGQIEQTPPAHSAVHVQGRRAYHLAREGKPADLPARTVTIHEIRLLRYTWPRLDMEIRCGGGTYIRALARDIGRTLGTGAYCAALTRTAVGPFLLDQAVAPERLDPARDLLPPLFGLELPTIRLEESQIALLRHGQAVPASADAPPEGAEAALLDRDKNRLLAIAGRRGRFLQPKKVFFFSTQNGV